MEGRRVSVKLHPEWRLVVEALSVRDYGTLVSHAELAMLTGLTYGTRLYYAQVNRARRTLLADWQRELEAVQKVGYRLVEPTEFLRRSRGYVSRSGKWLRRGVKTLASAPAHLLSDEQNTKNADTLAKIGAIESLRKRVMSETRPVLPPSDKPDNPRLLAG